MHNEIPRVVAIHDLSGFGRCSLSVISPTLSVMGVQCCAVPTTVLSTHTGGFGTPSVCDLTDYIKLTLKHYKEIDIDFDCVYTGYLGSLEQIDHCIEFCKSYPDALKVVDPVMGDHGKVYKAFTSKICSRMGELVAVADLITPNLTEASILLSQEYPKEPMTQSVVKSWLVKLSQLGPKMVIITGVLTADGTVANFGYEAEHNAFWRVDCDYVPAQYPGTGDLFASIIVGSILKGDSLPIAMAKATEFLEVAIRTTYSYRTDKRCGVMFEKALPYLVQNNVSRGYRSL